MREIGAKIVGPISQRAQDPLIKEYTSNHSIKGPYNLRCIPYSRGIGFSGIGCVGSASAVLWQQSGWDAGIARPESLAEQVFRPSKAVQKWASLFGPKPTGLPAEAVRHKQKL